MRLRHLLPITALVLSGVAVAPLARAETPPDIVLLKNGGMLRGTIQEMDPQGNVVIEFASGQQRTLSMSEVKYAGPASGAPQEAAPVAPPPPPAAGAPQQPSGVTEPLVRVDAKGAHLQLEGAGLTFLRKAGAATASGYVGGRAVALRGTVYETMCAAPCEITLPQGTYDIAVSKDGSPVETGPVNIDGDGRLEANYLSRSGTRSAGVAIAVLGTVAGSALFYYGSQKDSGGTPLVIGGAAGGIGSIVLGLLLALTSPDKADVLFFPSAPRPLHRRGDVRADSGSGFVGYELGLGLSMAL